MQQYAAKQEVLGLIFWDYRDIIAHKSTRFDSPNIRQFSTTILLFHFLRKGIAVNLVTRYSKWHSLCALALLGLGMGILTSCGGGSSELATAKASITKAENTKAKAMLAKSKADVDKINAEAEALYRSAKSNLDVEVLKGSTSANIGEAWFLLGKTSKELNLTDSALLAFKQADMLLGKDKKDEQMRSEMGLMMFDTWIQNINKCVELYNAAIGEENKTVAKQQFMESIKYAEGALAAKPENYDITYSLLAASYYQLEDTANAIKAQETYLATQKPMLEALTAKGVTYMMPRDEVIAKLGAPAEAKTDPAPTKGKDGKEQPPAEITRYYDRYTNLVAGKDVYLHYPKNKDKGTYLLAGFAAPPAAWTVQEKERDVAFDFNPYIMLAYNAYSNKNFDKAIALSKEGLAFKPTDENLSNLLPTLYTEGGKTDLALSEFKAMTEKNPNDKNALAQYGAMLANLEKYDDAIAQFEKALKVDPKFDVVLFNIAAAYKNKAGNIQREEQKKFDDAEAARKKDKKAAPYTMDEKRFKPLLVKSAEYFEEYRKLPGKDRDAQIIEQLLNVYEVVDDKPKYNKLAGEYIALEYANEKNPRYYEALARIYGKQKNSAKVKESLEKADALRKGGAK